MENKAKILGKIKALMEKTTENGASKAEMESAIAKAAQLMTDYHFSEFDLKNPEFAGECVKKEIPIIKTAYDTKGFIYSLTQLFDCKNWYSRKTQTLTFFGFEEDTEMCAYLYSLITYTCLAEKDRFVATEKKKNNHVGGRTLAADFIKGFMIGVDNKLTELLKAKNPDGSGQGLVTIAKNTQVQKQFNSLNKKFRTVKLRISITNIGAFSSGSEKGNNINLNKGVGKTEQETLLLK